MKTQTMKSAVLALVVLVPMLGSTKAMAVAVGYDEKIYTPMGCVKSGTDGVLTYDRADSISNTSPTQSLTVNCPLVRDSKSSIISGFVIVVDRSTNSSVSCVLRHSVYSVNSASPSTISGTPVLSPSGLNSNAMIRLSFSGTATPSGVISGISQYHYSCTLPPAESATSFSSLRSYEVNEIVTDYVD